MIANKKGLITAAILAGILFLIVLYSQGFETILYKFFSSKSTEGSRTLLYVYFMEHIWMVLLSSLLAVTIGTTLGIFVTTTAGQEFKTLLLKAVNLGQAFPSPALLALTVPILGYGIKGALIALVVYALMPITYNVIVGIEEVPKDIIDAAKGMGMTEAEIYIKVKIPLALNVMLGGIRTALVINISAATLAAAVGAGGLGVLVVNGVRTFDMVLILEGAIPVTLLAIIVELLLKVLQEKLIWTT
ncbi:Glycine betaine uptake system permease protein YehW [Jeotgalibaca dankookensis]|uniref:Glycine betaine uptake system permease protein YehW n=2 Tax=Jeotgalibaca dankookensis TaxID=708126 RepID=A0A1S6INI8_9LACT|nr:ABC transporter permease [Jeotgalibaca dankookensis]AQS53114.1 Glycine betaine uptake system permease protein YehW [Jeotgalibaca dankookensis]